MKKIAMLCAAASLYVCVSCDGPMDEKSYNQGINVIPVPVSLTQNEGLFKLTPQTAFATTSAEAKIIATYFAAQIGAATGSTPAVSEKELSSNAITLSLDNTLDLNNEGYTLEATPSLVTIKAKTPQGLFYGMQTFMQLLPAEIESPAKINGIAWTLPCVSIQDEPRFPYRGVMLDPSRHFIPVDNIKKQLDVFALFKINTFHWHLTDDQGWRIEIKKYPELTTIASKRIEGEGNEYGGFYTQEEIKEVVAYATERFINVIPEIELPGHELAAISAIPSLSCKGEPVTPRIIWGVEDVVMCAGKEQPFEFLEDVIEEVVPLFPGTYFHIGGDECPKLSWAKCPLCQKRIKDNNLKDEHGLQSYFVQRIEKVLEKHGKKMIGWDEILEGGLAPSATVMSWRGEEGGIAAANMNHDVIMTPGAKGMYLDHFQGDSKIEPVSIGGHTTLEKTYSYNPTPTELPVEKHHFIQGAQCNIWSEYMYTTDLMEYRMYPRLLAVAELTWSPDNRKDFEDFKRRINNAMVRLDMHNINYHIPQPEQPNGSCNTVAFVDSTSLVFTTSRPITVVYTLDGSEPTPSSTVYTEPIPFTESGVLKIRSVLPSEKMSAVRTINVVKEPFAPAKDVQTKPGLNMQYAYGSFLTAADLEKVSSWETKAIKGFNDLRIERIGESLGNVKPFAAIGTGYINIPEDGVYYFSSDVEQVWIDGKLAIDNGGETKRFSRHDTSMALAKGLHEFKVIFIGQVMGGWPTYWNKADVEMRRADEPKFKAIPTEMLSF